MQPHERVKRDFNREKNSLVSSSALPRPKKHVEDAEHIEERAEYVRASKDSTDVA